MSDVSIQVIQGEQPTIALYTPWDLTGYTIESQLRDCNGEGEVKATLIPTLQTNPTTNLPGLILLLLQKVESVLLEAGRADYKFDVRLTPPDGDTRVIPSIGVSVLRRVTK